MAITYLSAGVDIDAGEETVRRIGGLVKTTHNPAVLNSIGAFGALYDASFPGLQEPVLVSSVDGVGTKLKIASLFNRHNTIGQDLVNHCVNDILTCGAKPLFFLDYFATGKLSPDIAEQVVSGIVKACRENGCALIGGETAEMPGMYAPDEYDIAGTIVGIVEKARILNKEHVRVGDVLIALPSTGLHTNGFSLARAVLLKHFEVGSYIDELQSTLGEALLAVHRSYLHCTLPLLENNLIHSMSHITGGGLIGNTVRSIPKDLALEIDWDAWQWPPLFSLIQKLGEVPVEDMRRTFNLGLGLVYIVAEEQADSVMRSLAAAGENPLVIGKVVAA